jgi:hypothetical protein
MITQLTYHDQFEHANGVFHNILMNIGIANCDGLTLSLTVFSNHTKVLPEKMTSHDHSAQTGFYYSTDKDQGPQ